MVAGGSMEDCEATPHCLEGMAPSSNSEVLNNYFYAFLYIETISKIVVLIVCYRLIASSYWIPSLVHYSLVCKTITGYCTITTFQDTTITQNIPSQYCTPT